MGVRSQLTQATLDLKMGFMPIITLTTDFGTVDHYVASMKGVIWTIAPEVKIADVTHDVPPQDIAHAAFVLWQVWSSFPAGTVHVAVVDPGVGSSRAILVGQYADRFVIAPDNGLITWIHRDFGGQALHAVEDSQYFLPDPSNTFHGRDIIAPVAAHLANGVSLERFGPPLKTPCLLDSLRRASCEGDALGGRVIHIDRFGNLVTNIHADQLSREEDGSQGWEVLVNGKSIGLLRKTFSDVADGESVAMIGSAGFVEVSVRNDSAAKRFAPTADTVIAIRPRRS